MSLDHPRCSVVIPVYGNAHLTRTCLDSLLRQDVPFTTQIIVVDDASPDDTLEMLAAYGDRIEVVRRPVNGGYARACNAGLAVARGDYVLFLNNDTESTHQWLAPLVAYADAHPRAGVVGCRLLFANGQVQHAGIAFNAERHPVHLYRGTPGSAPHVSRNRVMPAVTGAVSLSPRSVLATLGGYDDLYDNEFEDIDLCLAVVELGFEVHYCADAILVHHEGSTEKPPRVYPTPSMLRFHRKWDDIIRPNIVRYLEEDGLVAGDFQGPGRMRIDYDPRAVTAQRMRMGSADQRR